MIPEPTLAWKLGWWTGYLWLAALTLWWICEAAGCP